jgi:uncharacterized protein (UPF0332 family)
MSAQEIAAYLDAAAEALGDSDALLARGSFRSAASRGYYAMFYCASALLLTKGMAFSRHGSVLSAFGRELAVQRAKDFLEATRAYLAALEREPPKATC